MLSEAKKQLVDRAAQICVDVLNDKQPTDVLNRRERSSVSQFCMDYLQELEKRFNQIAQLQGLSIFDEQEIQDLLQNASHEFTKLSLVIEGLAHGLPDGVPSEERVAYECLYGRLEKGPFKDEISKYMNELF